MRAAVLLLALLAWAGSAQDDFVPCASVHSVTGGEAGFRVQVAFAHVRALRCIMRIPITHVPANGTRFGPRAGTICENDGLGCIALDEPTYVIVDADIPTYTRALGDGIVLPAFDVQSQSVPFVHLPAQLSDTISNLQLPYSTWFSRLFGIDLSKLDLRGGAYLQGVMHDMTLAVVTAYSELINASDVSINPQIRVKSSQMIPNFTPLDVSDFVVRGARLFNATGAAAVTAHNIPWFNISFISAYPFRAVSPMFRELLVNDTALVAAMLRARNLGLSAVEAINMYEADGLEFRAYPEPPDLLYGGEPAPEVVAEAEQLIFPVPYMRIRNPSARIAGCLNEDDWAYVLGATNSSWAAQECEDSTQCAAAGVGHDRVYQRLRRTLPYHLSSDSPTCNVYQPAHKSLEQARIRLGSAVEVNSVLIEEVSELLELSPKSAAHYVWADSDAPSSFAMTIVTDKQSVPRLITEPVDSIYAMNCFSERSAIPDALNVENPYLDEPEFSAPSVLDGQRGTLIMSTADSDVVLGTGCGAMNFGQGFWRQYANKVATAAFSNRHIGPNMLNGTHATLTHKLQHYAGILTSAFQQTGSSCVAGARCKLYSPCSLIREELQWMRHNGRLPPQVPPFNPDAPALQPPADVPAWPNSPLEEPGQPVANVFNIITNKTQNVRFGCTPTGPNVPHSLSSPLWNPTRMNMWVGSHHMGSAEGRVLYVEDTHATHAKRISRGVSFGMLVDVPWTNVPHRHVTTDATGCVYMPIETLTASPALACRDVNPALAGTAFAYVPEANGTDVDLLLVVECIGPSFCPLWNASLASLIDADTGEEVARSVTAESDFLPFASPPELRYAYSRLRNSSVVGDGFAGGTLFEDLPDYTGNPPAVGEHIVFRFTQNVTNRTYIWEVHGTTNVSRALPDIFSREYFAQLFIGNDTGVAVSPIHAMHCHSVVDCELRPAIPAECRPPIFTFNTTLKYGNMTHNDPCDCKFWDWECQYNCGFLWAYWTLFGIVEIATIIGFLVYYWRAMQSRTASSPPLPPSTPSS